MKKFSILALSALMAITIILSLSVSVFASEGVPEYPATDEVNINEFSEAFDMIANNSDKIFAILAFLSSAIVAFAYKKGLIPIINKGLTAIKKSTDSFENAAKDTLIKTEKSLEFLTDNFVSCENTIDSVSRDLTCLSERLDAIQEEKSEKEKFKTVMLSQIDMLYDIFMQSGIPQYSKDALGEKIAKMKKELDMGEEND